MYLNHFKTFLESLETSNNKNILNTIHQGYKAIYESSPHNVFRNIPSSLDEKIKDIEPTGSPPRPNKDNFESEIYDDARYAEGIIKFKNGYEIIYIGEVGAHGDVFRMDIIKDTYDNKKSISDLKSEEFVKHMINVSNQPPVTERKNKFLVTDESGMSNIPEFKKWFGNSKITNRKGEPLIMYHRGSYNSKIHGSPNINEEGMHFGSEYASRQRPYGVIGEKLLKSMKTYQDKEGKWHWKMNADGISMDDISEAEKLNKSLNTARPHKAFFTKQQAEEDAHKSENRKTHYRLYDIDLNDFPLTTAYLSIQNPKKVWDRGYGWNEYIEQAKGEGHDGIMYINNYEDKGSASFIVFSPEQVKIIDTK